MADKDQKPTTGKSPSKSKSSQTSSGSTSTITAVTTPADQIIEAVTTDYLKKININTPVDPKRITSDLINMVNQDFQLENVNRDKNHQITLLDKLTFWQLAKVLIKFHKVARIATSGLDMSTEYDVIGIYQESGVNEGIYISSDEEIRRLLRRYCVSVTKSIIDEVVFVLREDAPRVEINTNPELIPVNNGIVHYARKELMEFSPDYVFLSKSKTNFNPNATSPVKFTPDGDVWEVEEWVKTLSDDEDVVHLIWEIIGAVVRPNVSWNKAAFFYSTQGNNGKGTLVHLMRELCGPGSHTSIPLSEMGKDFMLESIVTTSAIIVDENDVGMFIDKAANLKALITNDTILINRKHKQAIAHRFRGFMVQCLNELPKMKDKSDSLYRRQVFVPFLKSFTGIERKYIKTDYVTSPDVLEYVLKKVIMDLPDYYSLTENEATNMLLNEYKEYNNPVQAFWNEFSPQFEWDLVPYKFMYDLFKAWFSDTNPSGAPMGSTNFINELEAVVRKDPDWVYDKTKQYTSLGKMNQPEILIHTYDLNKWFTPNYSNKGPLDPLDRCKPKLVRTYRGVMRLNARLHPAVAAPLSDDELNQVFSSMDDDPS